MGTLVYCWCECKLVQPLWDSKRWNLIYSISFINSMNSLALRFPQVSTGILFNFAVHKTYACLILKTWYKNCSPRLFDTVSTNILTSMNKKVSYLDIFKTFKYLYSHNSHFYDILHVFHFGLFYIHT